MAPEEKAALKLDKQGIYSQGESILESILVTLHLRGESWTTTELEDRCITLLFGGFETTSGAMASMVALLARGHDRSGVPPPTPDDVPFKV